MGPTKKQKVLTGDRPTGRLHLGHLVGSLANRVALQETADVFVLVADLHVLTTRNSREDIALIPDTVRGMVLDYLGSGLDPTKVVFYLQSGIPEVCELKTLLDNLVTVNRLSRLPSLKEMARSASIDEELMPLGLLAYPVLQAADILLSEADVVPVGKDNEAHVEITREIARRFNAFYGEIFPVPEVMLSDTASLIGLDGKAKMSKSLGNAIMLSDPPEVVRKKVMSMYTDPNRVRADIPGTTEGNPVFIYHDAFNANREEVGELKRLYRAGKVGDVEVKKTLIRALEEVLSPIRDRISKAESEKGLVEQILLDGTERMRGIARETMARVRRTTGLDRTLVRFRRSWEKYAKRNSGSKA